MVKVRRTVSGRLTQVALGGALAAGALAAVAGLAGALATGPAASAGPVAGKAAAATAPTWRRQAPPEPAGTTDQAFGAVSCSSSSACLAIATHDNFEHGYGQYAETWNGSHWTLRTVPKAADVYLYGVKCRSAQWCVAVGAIGDGPVVDRWNGSGWKQAKPPVPVGATSSALTAVACSGTTACTAIGESEKGGGTPSLLTERWNGSAWKIQSVPAPSAGHGVLSAVACPAADACRAVGSDKGGLFSEIWNGSSWLIRPVPVPAGGSDADLEAVSCTAASSCEAVGTYSSSKGRTFLPLAEVWNGSHWLAQAPSTVAGATSSGLDAVSCVSATDCEAAAQAGTMAGPPQAGVLEKWNGTTWSVQEKVLPAGDTSASLSGISCTKGPVCEAVGYHGPAVDGTHLLALRYSS
jgi:hypothetical protein